MTPALAIIPLSSGPRPVSQVELAGVRFGIAGPFRVPVGRPGHPVTFADPESAERWAADERALAPRSSFRVVLVLPSGEVAR